LREQGYRYLVVSRERSRHFDPEQAMTIVDHLSTVRLPIPPFFNLYG